jgi:hypothetical protein
MADTGWLQIIGAALGGGFVGGITLKILDIGYQEFQRRRTERVTASKFVDEHLDPLLKSADELNGKLRSLAESDFLELYDVDYTKLSESHQFCQPVVSLRQFLGADRNYSSAGHDRCHGKRYSRSAPATVL